jgi:DNA transformation protein
MSLPHDDSLRDRVVAQLAPLGAIECRPMFGGYGLYRDGVSFAILYDGHLYFKTGSASRPRYVERGMRPFRPTPRQTLRTYYEVPAEVLRSGEELRSWAEDALSTHRG